MDQGPVQTRLNRVETYRFYDVTAAPAVTGRFGKRRTQIIPQTLKLSIGTSGHVQHAVVYGPALRRDGTIGTHIHANGWSWWPGDQPHIPDWVDAVIAAEGLAWATESEGRYQQPRGEH